MNKKLIGLLAGTSLALAGVAFAGDEGKQGTGGSPMGTSSGTMGSTQQVEHEITGQVVDKKGSTLYVQDKMGPVVQLKTDKSTKFEGINRDQIKEGDRIRASFDVHKKTDNLAKLIRLDQGQQGTGGTGMEDLGDQPSDF